jgi:cytochrome c556
MLGKIKAAAFVLLAASVATPLWAAEADERTMNAVETRQGLLKVVRSYFGPIVGMARGQIPYDGALVEKNAGKIAELTAMIPDVFRMNTSGASVSTEALDKIWGNTDDFAAKAANASEKASALAAAAANGQGPAMQAFGELGGACKGCHDNYRQQE